MTNDDLISRQAAIDHWQAIIDATNEDSRYNMGFVDGLEFCISDLSTMPPAQPDITPDGTLTVSIGADIASVGRILLSQTGTQRGGLYYKDVQPEPKWIPCKERLPDKDGLYLVTYFSGHARWTGTDEFLVDGTEESHWKYANIIAWQPLPKPFREGGDYA